MGFAAYAQAGQWVYVPDQYEGKKDKFFFAIYVISYFMQGTDISNLIFVKKSILKLKFWWKINFPFVTQIEKQLFHMFS